MVTPLLTIVGALLLASVLLTVAIGSWRHVAGTRLEADVHRQLVTPPIWVGVSSLVVVRRRISTGGFHR